MNQPEQIPEPDSDDDIVSAIKQGVMKRILSLKKSDALRLDMILSHKWQGLDSEDQHAMTAPYRLLYLQDGNLESLQRHVKACLLARYISDEMLAFQRTAAEIYDLPDTSQSLPQQHHDHSNEP